MNEEKTTICQIPEGRVHFLGYTIERYYTYTTERPSIGTSPSKVKQQRLCREISRLTRREWTWLDAKTQVERLNRMVVGWAKYFCRGRVSKPIATCRLHAVKRLRQWVCHTHKVRGQRGTSRFSNTSLHDTLGLINLETRIRNRPWAKA